jgi:CHAT domain-containing protein/tetratricopeptide (TPR) repeat protein
LDRNAEETKQFAERLIRGITTLPADASQRDRLELAWALKDFGAASWNSAPQDTVGAAHALDALCETLTASPTESANTEISAIREWVNGFADLTNGAMNRAIERFDSAATRFHAIGLETHATHTQIPKVIAFCILGEFKRADDCGKETLSKLLRAGDMHAACRLSVNLGNVSLEISDYSAALDRFQRGADIAWELQDFERFVSCQTGMANVHSMLGDFAQAIDTYSAASGIAKAHDLLFAQAVISESVALVRLTRGEYTAALRGFERARSEFEALNAPQNVAIAEKQLADSYLELRLLAEARTLLTNSIARFTALEMYSEKALGLAQLGRAFALSETTRANASPCFDQAEALFAEQGLLAGQASVKFARAELALFEREHAAARSNASESATIFKTLNLPANELAAGVIAAFAALESGAAHESETEFSTLLARAKDLELRSVEIRCLVGVGLVFQRRGDTQAAKEAFEAAIDAFEEQRRALPGDDIRNAFLVDHARPYFELLRIALAAHASEPNQALAGEAFRRVEQFRARALSERLGEWRRLSEKEGTAESDDEVRLRQRLNWLNRHLQQLIDNGDDTEAAVQEARTVERDLLERARRRRIATAAESNAQTAESTSTRTFNPETLRKVLVSETDVVVEYFAIDDELLAFIADRASVTLVREIASWSEVLDAIETARFQIETLRFGAETAAQHSARLNRRAELAMASLYRLLWAPIEAKLANKKRVLVVPHEQLGAIQFAALFDGTQYLAEKIDIAIVPSAQAACYGIAHSPRAPKRALVLGETTRLSHAKKETLSVVKLFDHAKLLIDEDATLENLRRCSGEIDVLHLACHAHFRSDNPMFSALELADQSFAAIDAETLNLRSAIVTLSGCETGVAQYQRGDEMFGLVRAFLVAGASRIVASLWAVDDATTMQFMGVFYQALKRGATPASALREAQRNLMKTHPHPFHWAAFVLYGGW